MSKALSSAGHSLVAVQDNLIDAIWEDRPPRPSTKLMALGLKYTGQHFSMDDIHYIILILKVSQPKFVLLNIKRKFLVAVSHVGLTWQDKITALRGKMAERKISWFVVTALDEIACMYHHTARFVGALSVSDHDPALIHLSTFLSTPVKELLCQISLC